VAFNRLIHKDSKAPDEELITQANAHLEETPAAQWLAEVLRYLADAGLPWWKPEDFLMHYPPSKVMDWFSERPDLRQIVTTAITGLGKNTARRKSPNDQAKLIDEALENNDANAADYQKAVPVIPLVLYGDAMDIWKALSESLDWTNHDVEHNALFAFFIDRLLASSSMLMEGMKRTPILTHLQVRSAIDEMVWVKSIPVETHVTINKTRLMKLRECPDEAFSAEEELTLVTSETIARSIPRALFSGASRVSPVSVGSSTLIETRSA